MGGNGTFYSSVGLYPAGLQALCLPNSESKEPRQQQRHQWFNSEGDLTHLKQGTGAILLCETDRGQVMVTKTSRNHFG